MKEKPVTAETKRYLEFFLLSKHVFLRGSPDQFTLFLEKKDVYFGKILVLQKYNPVTRDRPIRIR